MEHHRPPQIIKGESFSDMQKRLSHYYREAVMWREYNRCIDTFGYRHSWALYIAHNIATDSWELIEGLPVPKHDYAHTSAKEPGMVASAAPSRDKLLRQKPVRYLAATPLFKGDNSNELRDAWESRNADVTQLLWATEPKDIKRVYLNPSPLSEHSPSPAVSCMRYPNLMQPVAVDGESVAMQLHPVELYGMEQKKRIALAYFVDEEGRTTARALINTEAKLVGRIYAATENISDKFEGCLKAQGYSFDSYYALYGLLLPKLPADNYSRNHGDREEDERYLMPYIDGMLEPSSYDDGWWELVERNENTDNPCCTNGRWSERMATTGRLLCRFCDLLIHEDDAYFVNGEECCEACYNQRYTYCEKCERDVPIDNYDSSLDMCHDCRSERYRLCDECDEWVPDGSSSFDEDLSVCLRCRDEYWSLCDECGEWFRDTDAQNFDSKTGICISCRDNAFIQCPACLEYRRDTRDSVDAPVPLCLECRSSERLKITREGLVICQS